MLDKEKLKKYILQGVENQLRSGEPAFVEEINQQLRNKGCSKKEAKEMIACALLEEIYYVMTTNQPYNETRYEKSVRALIHDSEVFNSLDEQINTFEDNEYDDDAEMEADEILKAIYAGDDAAEKQDYATMAEQWFKAWEAVKNFVIDTFYHGNPNPKRKKTLIEIDDETDFKYNLYEWLDEMVLNLEYANVPEKRIQFCKEVMDLFDWSEEAPDSYKAAIAEALAAQGKMEECLAYYEAWISEEPDSIQCIISNFHMLIQQEDYVTAKQLLEKNLRKNSKCTYENDVLFYAAVFLYQKLGDSKNERKYREVLKKYEQDYSATYGTDLDLLDEPFMEEDGEWDSDEELPFGDDSIWEQQRPMVKLQKIYPNEPCPCGSGKKYKKCCGKGK